MRTRLLVTSLMVILLAACGAAGPAPQSTPTGTELPPPTATSAPATPTSAPTPTTQAASATPSAAAPMAPEPTPAMPTAAAELQDLFGQAVRSPDGSLTMTITEAQLTAAFQAVEQAGELSPTPLPVDLVNPRVRVTRSSIRLTGEVQSTGLSGPLTVEFTPAVEQGELRVELVAASFAGFEVPPALLQSAGLALNRSLAAAMSQLPQEYALQSVTLAEGSLTVIAKAP